MPSTTILLKIGVLVASFVIGIIFFYLMNKMDRQLKKQQIDMFLSYTINFILFIWAAKIIIHIGIFIEDPFAVLAYPSDSKAVYIASGFIVVQVLYHKYRKGLVVAELIQTMIPIFLATSFMYEFLHMILKDSQHALPNLLVVTILLLLYVAMHDRIRHQLLAAIIVMLYSVTHIVFYFIYSYTIVYEYMIHPIYFIVILIFTFVILLKSYKK